MLLYSTYFLLIAFLLWSLIKQKVLLVSAFYCSFAIFTVIFAADPELIDLKIHYYIYCFALIGALLSVPKVRQSIFNTQLLPVASYAGVMIVTLGAMWYAPVNNILTMSVPEAFVGRLAAYGLFLITAIQLQRRRDLMVFATVAAVISTVASGWVIWFAGQSDFRGFRGGLLVNQNYVSYFVLIGALPLVFVLFLKREYFLRLFAIAALLLMAYASFVMASLGMCSAAAAGATLIIFLRLKTAGYRANWMKCLIVVFAIGAGFYFPGSENLPQRFQEANIYSLDFRTEIWTHSLQHFAGGSFSQMLFGWGLFSSGPIVRRYASNLANAHNMYLEWLLETGLIGFAIFVLFLFSIGRQILKSTHPYKSLMAGWYIFLLVSGLTGTVTDDYTFWILSGVIIGACAWYQSPVEARIEKKRRRWQPVLPRPDLAQIEPTTLPSQREAKSERLGNSSYSIRQNKNS